MEALDSPERNLQSVESGEEDECINEIESDKELECKENDILHQNNANSIEFQKQKSTLNNNSQDEKYREQESKESNDMSFRNQEDHASVSTSPTNYNLTIQKQNIFHNPTDEVDFDKSAMKETENHHEGNTEDKSLELNRNAENNEPLKNTRDNSELSEDSPAHQFSNADTDVDDMNSTDNFPLKKLHTTAAAAAAAAAEKEENANDNENETDETALEIYTPKINGNHKEILDSTGDSVESEDIAGEHSTEHNETPVSDNNINEIDQGNNISNGSRCQTPASICSSTSLSSSSEHLVIDQPTDEEKVSPLRLKLKRKRNGNAMKQIVKSPSNTKKEASPITSNTDVLQNQGVFNNEPDHNEFEFPKKQDEVDPSFNTFSLNETNDMNDKHVDETCKLSQDASVSEAFETEKKSIGLSCDCGNTTNTDAHLRTCPSYKAAFVPSNYYKCSSCGTYHESWSFFLHIREQHNRFLCLYCVKCFPTAEKLSLHLEIKHDLEQNHFNSEESFSNSTAVLDGYALETRYLLCCTCQHIFEERTAFTEHVCMEYLKSCTLCGQKGPRHSNQCKANSFVKRRNKKKVKEKQSSQTSSATILDNVQEDASNQDQPIAEKITLHDQDSNSSNSNMVIDESCTTNHTISGNINPFDNATVESVDHQISESEIKSSVNENISLLKFKLRVPKEFQKPVDAAMSSSESDDAVFEEEVPADDDSKQHNSIDLLLSGDHVAENTNPMESRPEQLCQIDSNQSATYSLSENVTKCEEADDESIEEDDANPHLARILQEIEQTKLDIKRTKETMMNHPSHPHKSNDVKCRTFSRSENGEVVGSSDYMKTAGERSPKRNWTPTPPASPKIVENDEQHQTSSAAVAVAADNTSGMELKINKNNEEEEEKDLDVDVDVDVAAAKDVEENPNIENLEVIVDKSDENCASKMSPEKKKVMVVMVAAAASSSIDDDDQMENEKIDDEKNNNNESAHNTIDHQEREREDNIDSSHNTKNDDDDDEVQQMPPSDGIEVANEDCLLIELQLDKPLEKYETVDFVRICLKASYPFCLYCNHARRIAVNGESLVLHLIGNHRFAAIVDSITAEELQPDTIVARLKSFMPQLANEYFNTSSYCTMGAGAMTRQFNERIFECFQCRFVTATHKELYLHNRKMHLRTAILCFMCRCNFFSFSEILCHICPGMPHRASIFEIKFRCCLCDHDNIPSPFRLMVHLRKRHFACDICLEDCRDQSKLSSHVWKHKLHHLCYRCGIAYRNKMDITKHLFWKHGTESAICKRCLNKRWPHVYHFCVPPTTFVCDVCQHCFTKAMYLTVHKRIHAGDFRYPCTEQDCEEKFVSRKLLLKHSILHQTTLESSDSKEAINVVCNNNNESIDKVEKQFQSEGEEGEDDEEEPPKIQTTESCEAEIKNQHGDKDKDESKGDGDGEGEGGGEVEGEVEGEKNKSKGENENEGEGENGNQVETDENFNKEVEPKFENETRKNESEETKIVEPKLEEELPKSKPKKKKKKRSKESLEDLNLTAPNLSESGSSSESESDTKSKCDDEETKVTASSSTPPPQPPPPPPPQYYGGDVNKEQKLSETEDTKNNDNVLDIWKNFLQAQQANSSITTAEIVESAQLDENEIIESNDIIAPKLLHVCYSDHDYCQMFYPLSSKSPSSSSSSVVKQNKSRSKNKSMDGGGKKQRTQSTHGTAGDAGSSSSSDESSDTSSSSSCSCGSNCSCSGGGGGGGGGGSSSSSSSSSSANSASSNASRKRQRKKSERNNSSRHKKSESISPRKNRIVTTTNNNNNNNNNNEAIAMETNEKKTSMENDFLESMQTANGDTKNPDKLVMEGFFNESDLETAESETDEEYYDEHPQKLASEILSQKRAQLMARTFLSPSHNFDIVENSRPSTPSLPEDVVFEKRKKKKKRERKSSSKSLLQINHHHHHHHQSMMANNSKSESNFETSEAGAGAGGGEGGAGGGGRIQNQFLSFGENAAEGAATSSGLIELPRSQQQQQQQQQQMLQHGTPRISEGSSCSDIDGSLKRSKRARRPNKFYGYTSDDESMGSSSLGQSLLIGMRAFKPQPPPQLVWNKEDLPTPSKSILLSIKKTTTTTTATTTITPRAHKRHESDPFTISRHSTNDNEMVYGSLPKKKKATSSSSSLSLSLKGLYRKRSRNLPPIPRLKIRSGLLGIGNAAATKDNNSNQLNDGYNKSDESSELSSDDGHNRTWNDLVKPLPPSHKTHHHISEASSSQSSSQPAKPEEMPTAPLPLLPPTPQTTVFNHKIPPALLPNPDFTTLQYFKANNIRYPIRPPAGARAARDGESVYCYCRCPYDEVSEMIACDGDNCLIEWFHFECVGIMVAPQGKWFCAECRPHYSEDLYPQSVTSNLMSNIRES